jgi:hypothetical protein
MKSRAWPDVEDAHVFAELRLIELLQDRDVRDPHRPPERAGDQIALARMDHQIVHGHIRHVAFQPHPPPSAVDGREYSRVGAHKQQFRIGRVLDHHVDSLVREVRGDRRPRGAAVGRLEKIRLAIIVPVAAFRDVGRSGILARRDDARDPAVSRPARVRDGRRGISPRRAVCLRHLHPAVIGAHPDHARRDGRFRDRRDRAVLDVAAPEHLLRIEAQGRDSSRPRPSQCTVTVKPKYARLGNHSVRSDCE